MGRNLVLFLWLIVIIDPYQGEGIDYAENEPTLYEYPKQKLTIEVIEAEKDRLSREEERERRVQQKLRELDQELYFEPIQL